MDHRIIRSLKRLRSMERGAIDKRPAEYGVALVYPNLYYVGMSSLGFQLVYLLLNSLPGVRCERGFLIPGSPTVTLEGLRRLGDFDCIAFSLSCELDYFNLVEILRRAGIPVKSRERNERHPLVVGGGACVALNPEPVADVFDVLAVGEAEAVAPELFRRLSAGRDRDRPSLLESLSGTRGVYVPSLFAPRYSAGGRFEGMEGAGFPPGRAWVKELDAWPCSAPVVTGETEFHGRVLVELARGCGRRCRFCVADYVYCPPRLRSKPAVEKSLRKAISSTGAAALLGPSLSDYPGIEELCASIAAGGGRISISSLRADTLSGGLMDILAGSGLRSLTVAPETPSAPLKRKLNKNISAGETITVAEKAAAAGFRELKLYYMLGIDAGEEVEEIAEEVGKIAGVIPVRVNLGPLIPKANTPLQWLRIEEEKSLDKKMAKARRLLARKRRVRLSGGSVREAVLEAALSKGDRRMLSFISEGKFSRKEREKQSRAEYRKEDPLPWDHIGGGASKEYLWSEYERFERGELTGPCPPSGCRKCGVCG